MKIFTKHKYYFPSQILSKHALRSVQWNEKANSISSRHFSLTKKNIIIGICSSFNFIICNTIFDVYQMARSLFEFPILLKAVEIVVTFFEPRELASTLFIECFPFAVSSCRDGETHDKHQALLLIQHSEQSTFYCTKRFTRNSNVVWDLNWILLPFLWRKSAKIFVAVSSLFNWHWLEMEQGGDGMKRLEIEFSLNAYLRTRFDFFPKRKKKENRSQSLNISFNCDEYWHFPGVSKSYKCDWIFFKATKILSLVINSRHADLLHI